jgi:DNA-binding transcriptional MerR regulator
MRITETADRIGLSADTIRFYEKSGMLPQIGRDAVGWRVFAPSDLEWLQTLSHLRNTGMPLDEIKAFATSAHASDCDAPAQQNQRLAILQRHAQRLAQRRAELDACNAFLTHKINIYSQGFET